jgi:hypothetical protein
MAGSKDSSAPDARLFAGSVLVCCLEQSPASSYRAKLLANTGVVIVCVPGSWAGKPRFKPACQCPQTMEDNSLILLESRAHRSRVCPGAYPYFSLVVVRPSGPVVANQRKWTYAIRYPHPWNGTHTPFRAQDVNRFGARFFPRRRGALRLSNPLFSLVRSSFGPLLLFGFFFSSFLQGIPLEVACYVRCCRFVPSALLLSLRHSLTGSRSLIFAPIFSHSLSRGCVIEISTSYLSRLLTVWLFSIPIRSILAQPIYSHTGPGPAWQCVWPKLSRV